VYQIETDEQILLNVLAQSYSEPGTSKLPKAQARPELWKLPGFSGKSRVLTSFGHLPIEALRRNDPIRTSVGSYVKVTWIDKIGLDAEFLATNSQAQPVFIPAGSIGGSKPATDMLISPGQVVQTACSQLGRWSSRTAGSLVGVGSISRKPQNGFTYYLFGCDTACSVCVDGIWCEVEPKAVSNTD
jgi:hypothetical protein